MKKLIFFALLATMFSCSEEYANEQIQPTAQITESIDFEKEILTEFSSLVIGLEGKNGVLANVASFIQQTDASEEQILGAQLPSDLGISNEQAQKILDHLQKISSLSQQSNLNESQLSELLSSTSFEKGTPCYDQYEATLGYASAAAVTCMVVTSASMAGPIACAVAYVGTAAVAKVTYDTCLETQYGGG